LKKFRIWLILPPSPSVCVGQLEEASELKLKIVELQSLITALNVESRRPAAFDYFEDYLPGHERACQQRILGRVAGAIGVAEYSLCPGVRPVLSAGRACYVENQRLHPGISAVLETAETGQTRRKTHAGSNCQSVSGSIPLVPTLIDYSLKPISGL
jgi:hypothetical protein